MSGPYRDPPEETSEFPGLFVHDDRVTGSITAGQSRLPLWAFVGQIPTWGWESAQREFHPEQYGWTAPKMGDFLHDLMQLRGEFGRLILVLADAERRERRRTGCSAPAWWETKTNRQRVAAQLRRCLACLEGV